MRAVVLNITQLIEKIERHNYRFVKVYPGHLSEVTEAVHHFDMCNPKVDTDLNDAECVTYVKNFILNLSNQHPTKFTVLMSKAASSNVGGRSLVLVDFQQRSKINTYEPQNPGVYPAGNYTGVSESPEDMEKRIKTEILKDLEAKRENYAMQRKIQELEIDKQRSESLQGMIYGVVQMFIQGVQQPAGAAAPLQGNIPNEQTEGTEDLQEALTYLVDTFTEPGVIKLCELLKKQPSYINMIKSQIQ